MFQFLNGRVNGAPLVGLEDSDSSVKVVEIDAKMTKNSVKPSISLSEVEEQIHEHYPDREVTLFVSPAPNQSTVVVMVHLAPSAKVIHASPET